MWKSLEFEGLIIPIQTRIKTESGYTCTNTKTMKIFYTKDFEWHEDASLTPTKDYLEVMLI